MLRWYIENRESAKPVYMRNMSVCVSLQGMKRRINLNSTYYCGLWTIDYGRKAYLVSPQPLPHV